MSLPISVIDTEFEELESKALRGIWDDAEQDRLYHVLGMEECKTNGTGTTYAHTRITHLGAVYSTIMSASETGRPEMNRTLVSIAGRYLKRYPSSRKFFISTILDMIEKQGGDD